MELDVSGYREDQEEYLDRLGRPCRFGMSDRAELWRCPDCGRLNTVLVSYCGHCGMPKK